MLPNLSLVEYMAHQKEDQAERLARCRLAFGPPAPPSARRRAVVAGIALLLSGLFLALVL